MQRLAAKRLISSKPAVSIIRCTGSHNLLTSPANSGDIRDPQTLCRTLETCKLSMNFQAVLQTHTRAIVFGRDSSIMEPWLISSVELAFWTRHISWLKLCQWSQIMSYGGQFSVLVESTKSQSWVKLQLKIFLIPRVEIMCYYQTCTAL
ncbi:hypothetical protein HS088_TW18G00945 [Tripterygium wilfordii]|uniref:Uncharacterized protein n=1 Tax=Tripterygium wilfordii TaxID=458696 RepID=A0A7J7CDK8_TRIWF|nr:hypothetical protein HS088_TW18G00945 [Tripterygium wilfordii]